MRQWRAIRIGAVRRRGFALVAAIGVLAILVIFAVAAAGVTQFTIGFSQARAADRRLGAALEQSAALLASRPPQALSADGAAHTFALVEARPGSRDDVAVTATVGLAPDPGLLGPALALREGDTVVRLEARRPGGRYTRTATYLMNTAGQRRTPILLQESRL